MNGMSRAFNRRQKYREEHGEYPTTRPKNNTIKVKREVDGGTQVEKCEIFTFPTEENRQDFIADLRKFDPEVAYATNMDPEESEPERYLVAIPIRFYNWATEGK